MSSLCCHLSLLSASVSPAGWGQGGGTPMIRKRWGVGTGEGQVPPSHLPPAPWPSTPGGKCHPIAPNQPLHLPFPESFAQAGPSSQHALHWGERGHRDLVFRQLVPLPPLAPGIPEAGLQPSHNRTEASREPQPKLRACSSCAIRACRHQAVPGGRTSICIHLHGQDMP